MAYFKWLDDLRRTPYRKFFVAGLLAILGLIFLEAIGARPPVAMRHNGQNPPPAPQPFAGTGALYEAPNLAESTSSYWWVNSGAELLLASGTASTASGALPANDHWRILYAESNPQDTDNGYHPQNIFRLVTKDAWQDMVEESYFKIDATNMSTSSNRNESNGLLLLSRYEDGDNLYYVGIRVDGAAVIKKKINGTYYTMTYQSLFPGRYDPVNNPNLLPLHTWIGLREVIKNTANGAVIIQEYVDIGKTGNWIQVAEAEDDGRSFGGPPFLNAGHAGIRTDFMDVEFDGFTVTQL